MGIQSVISGYINLPQGYIGGVQAGGVTTIGRFFKKKALRFDNAPGRITEKPANLESAKPLIPQKVRNTNGLRVTGINGISISYKLSHEFSVDLYRFSLIPLIPLSFLITYKI